MSTLGSFAQTTSPPTAFSVGVYPSDWSLFDTGDPAPGHPFEWERISTMWRDKAQALDIATASFTATGSINGQGYQVRYINDSLSMGSSFTKSVQAELLRIGEVAQKWAATLADIQARAHTAHRIATQSQEQIEELSAKISFLSADLGFLEAGPERADTQQQVWGLNQELEDARQVLEQQRQVIRELASEYSAAAATAQGSYLLTPTGDLVARVRGARGAFTPSLARASGEVSLFDLSAETMRSRPPVSAKTLANLAKKAYDSPEALKEYLASLAQLSPAEIADYAAAYPELARLPVAVSHQGKDNALVVRDWWNSDRSQELGLTTAQRAALVRHMPGFVGNLEGVRYSDRDAANRLLLDFYLAHPELTSEHAQKALDRVQWALEYERKGVRRSLINLDLSLMNTETYVDPRGQTKKLDLEATDDVLISLAYGDLDEADAVTILNPGMLNHAYASLDPDGGDMAGMGQSIYQDQEMSYKDNSLQVEHAVILNLNYVTPQGLDVLSMGDARRAAERNANSVDALNVLGNSFSLEEQNRKVYLWNHSYGSTTAGETIRKVQTPVQAYYNVGSAGWVRYYDAALFEHLAKDDQGRPQMYSALADADWVAQLGINSSLRLDPRTFENSFEVSAEVSADGEGMAVQGHDVHPKGGVGYNTPGSTTYRAGIWITTGQVDEIPAGDIRFNPDEQPSAPQPLDVDPERND